MKKKYLLLLFCLLLFNVASAQTSNAIIFTENGEKFTVILNGVRQNELPETNVKISGLNAEFYKLKVIFNNSGIGEKNFNLYINQGTETSYAIRKNYKGEYVIRLISEVPMAMAPLSPANQMVVVYVANPASAAEAGTVTRTTTTETAMQTVENPQDASVNTSINRNDNGGNISINTNVTGTEEDQSEMQTTVVRTTTTTTTKTVSSRPAPIRPASYVPGYTGEIGCPVPMSQEEFSDLKTTISSKTFEDTRMTIAKQVLNDRCMVVDQVKEVMTLFTFEDNRLQFAKFAYSKTYDIGNYYKVNKAFTFENSTDELNEYIDSHK